MVRKILLGALALVALLAAPAAAQYDPLVISPPVVVPGGQVTISGQGCQGGEEVSVYLLAGNLVVGSGPDVTLPAGATLMGTTTADAAGNFTFTFTIPVDTAPGVYTIAAVCGSLVQSESLTVSAPAAPPGPGTTPIGDSDSDAGSGSGSLPRTGSDLDGLGLVGVALLVVGGLVLLATRRRAGSTPASA